MLLSLCQSRRGKGNSREAMENSATGQNILPNSPSVSIETKNDSSRMVCFVWAAYRMTSIG
jgi:hypothetical protein